MNWSSLQYIVQQLEQDTHRPDCVGTVNDIMYSRYSTLIRQPLLAHIESPPAQILAHSEGHPGSPLC